MKFTIFGWDVVITKSITEELVFELPRNGEILKFRLLKWQAEAIWKKLKSEFHLKKGSKVHLNVKIPLIKGFIAQYTAEYGNRPSLYASKKYIETKVVKIAEGEYEVI